MSRFRAARRAVGPVRIACGRTCPAAARAIRSWGFRESNPAGHSGRRGYSAPRLPTGLEPRKRKSHRGHPWWLHRDFAENSADQTSGALPPGLPSLRTDGP